MISENTIKEIKQRLIQEIKPSQIILFGSYARGNPHQDSDLDLFIVKKTSQPKYKRGREIRKSLRDFMVPLDIIVYTPEEVQQNLQASASFVNTIMREGKILYHDN